MKNMINRHAFLLIALFLLPGAVSLCHAQSTVKPGRALLYSALFPGGGQIYNRSWVKAGAVIGVQGWLIGSAIHNSHQKNRYNNLAASAAQISDQAYYNAMETEYRNRLNNDIWWIGITAGLSMIDAYVDAHLHDFEEQDRKLKLRFSDTKLGLEYRF